MESYEKSAKEWLDNCSSAYKLERNDAEKKLVFTIPDAHSDDQITFYLNCPESEDGKLTVWSDCTRLHEALAGVLEYCEGETHRSLTNILDRMDAAVTKLLQTEEEDDDDDEEDDFDDDCAAGYYVDEDKDAETEEVHTQEDKEEDDDDETFFGKGANPFAFQRLTKDLKSMKRDAPKYGIVGNPRGDNLFIWDVKLTGFSTDTKLGKDLQDFAAKYNREPVVYLEMQFPGDYPMSPPFVRVTRPRFKFLTGHVTIGGSICMEMLTKSGWRPTNDIEGILVQIRSEIMSDKNARLDGNPDRAYDEQEAQNAFQRMVQRYGWNS